MTESGGKQGDEQGRGGGIVGQNVKLELIRAHRGANEWLIVIADRRARRNNPGLVLPGFTSPSPIFSLHGRGEESIEHRCRHVTR